MGGDVMHSPYAPVMIFSGGTGGHIFPGLAVARVLMDNDIPVTWVGTRTGMEQDLVRGAAITIHSIDAAALRGKGIGRLLSTPFTLLRAVWQALSLIRKIRPRAVICFGGFVSAPGGLAAWIARKPLLIHEQNSRPGLSNRLLAPLARVVMCGFPQSFDRANAEFVGNPIRPEILALASSLERAQSRGEHVNVLVMGGSQGARALNLALPAVLAKFPQLQIRHQCGKAMLEETRGAYAAARVQARVDAFIADMPEAYQWADLVIARAGASTISELCAVGVASILVPLPGSADNHQHHNAEFLEDAGAAVLVTQGEHFVQHLEQELHTFLQDPERLAIFGRAARETAILDAAERVADFVISETLC